MISVPRDGVERPSVLDPEAGPGFDETEKNKLEAAKEKPAFEFKAYKNAAVKRVLHRLFRGKCAYCETRYVAAQPMDVEHFRPKKKVEKWQGLPPRRGYYWLGADWENLLPSCIDCNRRRTHFDEDDDSPGEVLGKRAIFPVADEHKRWASHDQDPVEEQPLLLNPCDDHPEELLRFTREGIVKAASGLDDLGRKRVEASIEIYGLNRPGLVLERLAWIRLLEHKMEIVERVVVLIDELEDDVHAVELDLAEDLLQFLLTDLRACEDPDRPYSLAARHVIDKLLRRFE